MAQNFAIIHFPNLQIGTNFVVEGEAFTKTSELMYRDSVGMEHHIDFFFDAKLGRELEAAKAAQVGTQQPTAPTIQKAMDAVFGEPTGSALGGLSDSDIERIAQRVAAILKEKS